MTVAYDSLKVLYFITIMMQRIFNTTQRLGWRPCGIFEQNMMKRYKYHYRMKTNRFVCHAMLVKLQLVFGLLFLFTFSCIDKANAQGAQVIYVRKGASAPGDGASWATAYPDLQQALAAATTLPGNKEIWVARGEYKPTSTLDRTISFLLPG